MASRDRRRGRSRTVFTSNYGLIRFTRMTLGLKRAPGTLQLAMDALLTNVKLQFALDYLNDIVIFLRMPEGQISRVRKVPKLLINVRVTLNSKKYCVFHELNQLPCPVYLPRTPQSVNMDIWRNTRTRSANQFDGISIISWILKRIPPTRTEFRLPDRPDKQGTPKWSTADIWSFIQKRESCLGDARIKAHETPYVGSPTVTRGIYCKYWRMQQTDWLCSATKGTRRLWKTNWIVVLFVKRRWASIWLHAPPMHRSSRYSAAAPVIRWRLPIYRLQWSWSPWANFDFNRHNWKAGSLATTVIRAQIGTLPPCRD